MTRCVTGMNKETLCFFPWGAALFLHLEALPLNAWALVHFPYKIRLKRETARHLCKKQNVKQQQ